MGCVTSWRSAGKIIFLNHAARPLSFHQLPQSNAVNLINMTARTTVGQMVISYEGGHFPNRSDFRNYKAQRLNSLIMNNNQYRLEAQSSDSSS